MQRGKREWESGASERDRDTYECRDSGHLAALHNLPVACPVGGDEDHLSVPLPVRVFDELHYVGTAAWERSKRHVSIRTGLDGCRVGEHAHTARLGVPEAHSLRPDMLVNQAGDGGSKRLLLVGADPNEVPGWKPAAVSTQA